MLIEAVTYCSQCVVLPCVGYRQRGQAVSGDLGPRGQCAVRRVALDWHTGYDTATGQCVCEREREREREREISTFPAQRFDLGACSNCRAKSSDRTCEHQRERSNSSSSAEFRKAVWDLYRCPH